MKLNVFQKWAIATLLATLFLVFVGGFVRVAGAGLGCPDWPRCWGRWLPPADVSMIDASRYDVSQFNALKMWIEYLNRLVGMAVGLLVLGTFVLSIPRARRTPSLTVAAFGALVLVLFQAWLGGQVVESRLAGHMITWHMFVAVVLLSLLIWIAWRASREVIVFSAVEPQRGRLRLAAGVFFLLCVVQVVLGAETRESIEWLAHADTPIPRDEWVANAGPVFAWHRSFAWSVVAAVAAMVWFARGAVLSRAGRFSLRAVVVGLGLQVGSGVVLAYLGLPAALQVVHLGLSTILCCFGFLLVVGLGPRRVEIAGDPVSVH